MAQNLIHDEQIAQMQNLNNELKQYPSRLKTAAITFREVINNSDVAGWTNDTGAGRQTRQNVIKNCDGIDQLADTITELYQSIERLIAASKMSNNKTE